MAPKRTLTSAALPMTQAAIKKLVADSVATALEAQVATIAVTDNTNRNTGQSGTPIARKCTYKEFMSCQPLYFIGTEGTVGLIRWCERTESVFSRSNCTKDSKVKFYTGTLTEDALSWWNSFAQPIGIKEAYKITWSELKRLLTKKTLHFQVSDLQQVGSPDQELQKQRASHWKQLTTSISDLSCLWGERALQKSVPKSKQQYPWENIHAEGQECHQDFEHIKVMDAPTLPVSTKRNLGDPIEIRVDIVHPVPVDVFLAATVVRTIALHGEAIRGIHRHLKGVPINEEMSALRFRMGMAEEENASLRGKIKTMEATNTVTRRQEKRARMELERQLASFQESQRQDQENFRKLQEFVTSQLGRHS
ncbi:hypothetical protein Tco_0332875 [Tanacetum coccineum]